VRRLSPVRQLQLLLLCVIVLLGIDIGLRLRQHASVAPAVFVVTATAAPVPPLTSVPPPPLSSTFTALPTTTSNSLPPPTVPPTTIPTAMPSSTATSVPVPTATIVVPATATPTLSFTATATPAAPPTAPPTSTPTRGPLRVTKLGVGVYASGGAILPDMDRMRPSVILLMDPAVDFAREVRTRYPKAFIIGRHYVAEQPLDRPEERGRQFADRVSQFAVPLKGTVNAWMSYNEVSGSSATGNNYAAWNVFQVAFAHQLQDVYGVDAVAGNDATASVEVADYPRYFAEAFRVSHYIGFHAYAARGDTSMRASGSKDLLLRYRAIHAALQSAGIQAGPMILTETGLWDGWRGVASGESMATDFIWLADELDKDPYLLGMTLFGLFLPGSSWEHFNVGATSIPDRIGSYNSDPPRR